jgi:hypothetical protein
MPLYARTSSVFCHLTLNVNGPLVNIKSDIEAFLAKGYPTAIVMLDLSAAFDTIDHTMLLT